MAKMVKSSLLVQILRPATRPRRAMAGEMLLHGAAPSHCLAPSMPVSHVMSHVHLGNLAFISPLSRGTEYDDINLLELLRDLLQPVVRVCGQRVVQDDLHPDDQLQAPS